MKNNKKYYRYSDNNERNKINAAFQKPHKKIAVSVRLADGISDAVASGIIDDNLNSLVKGMFVIRVGDQFLLDENDDGIRAVFINEIVNLYKIFVN